MKSILTFFAIVFFLISCREASKVNTKSFKTIIVDTFSYERIQQTTKVLNYSSLENGVDSFELRLWTALGHTDLRLVKILKYEDSNWHLSETRYWISGDSSFPNLGSKIFLDSGNIEFSRLITPISPLLDTLFKLNLNTFPTQSQISGFSDNVAGGFYYDLEVATKNYYKHLSYHEPDRYSDNSNRNFSRIVKLLWTRKSD